MQGNFFKSRRDQLGLTQRDIALRLNMTTSAVSQWELGNSMPQVALYDKLAEVYGVSAERISREVLSIVRAQRRNEVTA